MKKELKARLIKYNKMDVLLTEKLYLKSRSWPDGWKTIERA